MASPFPGMDPYIEEVTIWPGFHNALLAETMRALNRVLPVSYFAELDERVEVGYADEEDTRLLYPDVTVAEGARFFAPQPAASVEFSPATTQVVADAAVRQRVSFIKIKAKPEDRVVTVIELLSPINKRPGNEAHEEYRAKRKDILASGVHLVELDLLRKGRRPVREDTLPPAPYYAFISRADRRPYTDVWAVHLEDPLPVLPIPLLPGDGSVPLALGEVVANTYEAAALDRRIDYNRMPGGPLTDAERAFIAQRLAWYRQETGRASE